MTRDEQDDVDRRIDELHALVRRYERERDEARAQLAAMRLVDGLWKDRYEAELQAHEADIKHFERVYNCTGPQQ
jgi:hypothetical protein